MIIVSLETLWNGTTDAEAKVPFAENPELSKVFFTI